MGWHQVLDLLRPAAAQGVADQIRRNIEVANVRVLDAVGRELGPGAVLLVGFHIQQAPLRE
jgi:hypothetical protein